MEQIPFGIEWDGLLWLKKLGWDWDGNIFFRDGTGWDLVCSNKIGMGWDGKDRDRDWEGWAKISVPMQTSDP